MKDGYWFGVVSGVVVTLVVLLLFACDAGARMSGPAHEEREAWRGAVVTGARPAEAIPHIEAGWQRTPRDWEPAKWRIVMEEGPIACAGAIGGSPEGCRGMTTTWPKRVIRISWINGPADVGAIAWWELCNARAVSRGGPIEQGC